MNRPNIIPYILRSKVNDYCRVMTLACGHDPVRESRLRPVVTARCLLVYRLLLEGFTEHAVGACIGWDHSTIHHYRKKAVNMLSSPGYDAERELWHKFNAEII